MPFTISHIAAVLPFGKRTPFPLSFTGLIVGSMAPDFEYFIRMTLYGHYGHTFPGIFIFDLPVSILLYLIYHGILRHQLLLHLPGFIYGRFAIFIDSKWSDYFRRSYWNIILSILLGTLTHLLWDGFTHDREYVVAIYVPVLMREIHLGAYTIPVYSLLQGFSTIAGLLLLLVFIYRMPQTPASSPVPARERRRYWAAVVSITCLVFAIRWLAGVPDEKFLGQVIVISMSSSMLAVLIVSFYYDTIKPQRHDA